MQQEKSMIAVSLEFQRLALTSIAITIGAVKLKDPKYIYIYSIFVNLAKTNFLY